MKRVRPELAVFSVQGDGDMGMEGLHEIFHAAGRGERITAIMLNNGVFGDTGGQMTASTVLGICSLPSSGTKCAPGIAAARARP